MELSRASDIDVILERRLQDANREVNVTRAKRTAPKARKSLTVALNEQYVRDVTSARNTNQNNRNDASSDDDVSKQVVRAVVQRVRQRR